MNLNDQKMKNYIPPIFFFNLKLIYTAWATNSTLSKDYQCMSCIASDRCQELGREAHSTTVLVDRAPQQNRGHVVPPQVRAPKHRDL